VQPLLGEFGHFISCSNRFDSASGFGAYILDDNMFVVNGKVIVDGKLSLLKRSHKIGNSYQIVLPKEWLWAIGEPREFLIYQEKSRLIVEPYTGQGRIVYDCRRGR